MDTPVNWWHQLEGGEIAQQRPPPPGVDAPYPKVGTTPAKAPDMLSPELRSSLTEHLVEQRNLSARLNADDPITVPDLPSATPAGSPGPGKTAAPPSGSTPSTTSPGGPAPSSTASKTAPAANPAMSSATLDAAEAPSAAPVAPDTSTQPGELAMPEIVPEQAGILPPSGPTPTIPTAPPSAPGLPGFVPPPPPTYAAVVHPNYVLTDQTGEALLFPDGSDALSPGQDATLRELATRRGKAGIIYVHGFGDARSDAPGDQAQALTLAVLRARTVADLLGKHGVPADAIRLRAAAFGRGATAGLID